MEAARHESPEDPLPQGGGLRLADRPHEEVPIPENPRSVLAKIHRASGVYTPEGEFKPALGLIELMRAALEGNEDALSDLGELGDALPEWIESHADSDEARELFDQVVHALHEHRDSDTVELIIEEGAAGPVADSGSRRRDRVLDKLRPLLGR